MNKRYRKESGEIMLESVIIFTITLFVLVCMLGLGFLLCQQAMVYTIATETAEGVADKYKYTTISSIDDRYISSNESYGLKKYRTSLALLSMQRTNKEKAISYVKTRAKMTSLSPDETATVTDMQYYIDNIGRTHVTVTVAMDCNLLFFGALQSFGIIDDLPKLEATASAECIDITGYAGQVNFVNYVGEKFSDSNLGKSYENISKSISNCKSIIDKIVN